MKKYIGPVLSLASVGMLFYIVFNQKQQIKELKSSMHEANIKIQLADSLIKITDSLVTEVFIERTKAERYEITLERLRSEDSLSAFMFESYLNQCE